MFYSYEILERRGRFGVVWLAATKAGKLTRKDYSRVNVRRTCDDIIKVIKLKGVSSRPHKNKPRFSLYLSAQLMYGVVCVFEKQCLYLNDDVSRLYGRFHQTRKFLPADTVHIDLPPTRGRPAEFCTLPDPVAEKEFFELDPLFGSILRSEDMTSFVLDPYSLPQVEPLLTSPTHSEYSSERRSPKQQMLQAIGSPHTVSSQSDISLKEIPQISVPDVLVPGELDLPPLGTDLEDLTAEGAIGLDALLSPLHDIPPGDREEREFKAPVESTPAAADDVWIIDPETGALTLSPIHVTFNEIPTKKKKRREREVDTGKEKQKKKTRGAPQPAENGTGDVTSSNLRQGEGLDDRVRPDEALLQEPPAGAPKMDSVSEVQGISSPEHAIPSEMDLATPSAGLKRKLFLLELSPLEEPPKVVTPKRSKKRRRLVFADATIQITKDELRRNFTTSNELCSELSVPQVRKYPTAKSLFEGPSRHGLHMPLVGVWQRNSQTLEAEYSTDEERAIWSVAHLHGRRPSPSEETTTESDLEENLRRTRRGHDDSSVSSIERPREESIISGDRSAYDMTGPSLLPTPDTSHSLDSSKDLSITSAAHLHSRSSIRPGTALPKIEEIDFELSTGVGGQEIEQPDLTGNGEAELPELAISTGAGDVELPDLAMSVGGQVSESTESEEESHTRHTPTLLHTDLVRKIGELTTVEAIITFEGLVPKTTPRNIAAKIFSVCLDFAAVKVVGLDQDVAYGPIYITRGPNF
ncbi:meiotic recombination protein REC8 homolog [Glandiceps talaboti]